LFKPFWGVSEVKARVKSPILERAGDPKPGELAMARVNPREIVEEARTREPCNTLG